MRRPRMVGPLVSDPACYTGAIMWLATQHGFYSIVQKAPDQFHVRARVRRDLDNLLRLVGSSVPVYEWPAADYRYRIIIGRRQLIDMMAALALSLDYPNFKEKIASLPDQRPKLEAFHEVWEIMAGLQQNGPAPGAPDRPRPVA